MSSGEFIVTIDGPAASGKTTVSREIARRLSCAWVSTGAFYRGLAYMALQKKVGLQAETELATLCRDHSWKVVLTPENTLVFADNVDVTAQLLKEEIGQAASKVSQFPLVRRALLAAQRACALPGKGLVAEGRDCGSVVFPNADVKIFITADSESRAQRRADQGGGQVHAIKKEHDQRDKQDSSRAAAPLQIPENAKVFDTTTLGLADVVERVSDFVSQELEKLHKT